MTHLKNIQFLLFSVCILIDYGIGYLINSNPYVQREILDNSGKYQLEWQVNWLEKRVTFNVTVETRGYIGFGLSDNGKMSGADIVIGGVLQNGEPYFSDRHAVNSQVPEEEESQDWKLEEARENRTHTFLSFSRDFDTCDPQDYNPIGEDKIALIWCYGERDEVKYHHSERGVFQVYLLDPNYAPNIKKDETGSPSAIIGSSGEQLEVWTINSVVEMPRDEVTAYSYTLHKAPILARKHHIVGLDVRFDNEKSRGYVHHLLIFKCNPAHEHEHDHPTSGPIQKEYCTELLLSWGSGGRPFFNPPHIGFPFGTSTEEYYLVQMYFDYHNRKLGGHQPEVVDIKLDIFYTSQLRPHEGGILNLKHTSPGIPPSFLIPPSSVDHKIHAICGSHCTREILPGRGIHIYGLLLHSHNSGRKMKVQHFRQTRELPWIIRDDNFKSGYQQVRILPEERTVLPWDVMVLTCEYDNTWMNGTVVGGYGTRQEMCSAYILYYNKLQAYQTCSSEIGSPDYRQRLLSGVRNISWSEDDLEFRVGWGHPLKGMRISEVSDKHVDWTEERRNELQKFQLRGQHVNWCYPERYAWGATERTPETELVPPRPKRQKQASRSIGRRRRRRQSGVGGGGLTPTSVPRYEPEWQDPRRFSHYPKEAKAYKAPKRSCVGKL